MKRWMVTAAAIGVLTAAAPASAFEFYVRADGGMEYLDLTAIDFSGLLNPDNYDPSMLTTYPDLNSEIDNLTKEYKGEGWAVGAQGGFVLLDFLDVGIDFRQAGLYFDKTDGKLTQLVGDVGFHFLGTDTVVDPSILFGVGYCYLTTQIPEINGTGDLTDPNIEQTANGFIGRAGVGLDFRFVTWMSVGVAGDFSFLYFDGGTERQAWGFNTDVLGRVSFHI
jgi:hypothetical protein